MRRTLLLLGALVWPALAEDEAATETPEIPEDDAQAIFSEEDLAAMDNSANKHEFEAEVKRLMEIIIHSLYTDRDIFLRELISNSADALDKTRYQSLTDKSALDGADKLEIKVRADAENNILTITDTGIGMTAKELEENLGTVARSGTAKFIEAFTGSGDDNALNMIGQFGVGFYSSFLVADELIVVSKSNMDDTQHVWKSMADGSFTVSPDPRGNTLGRGTQVILKMKEDSTEYLESDEIERIVQRYSQFQTHPIKLFSERTESRPKVYDELSEEEKALLEEDDDDDDDDDLSVEDEEEGEDEEPEMEDVKVNFWKVLNEQKPLWLRNPQEIEEDEYQGFYKSFAKSSDDFLSHVHFRAEGQIEFSSILFIPKKAPYGLYDNYYTNSVKLSLYVRRVLVGDEFDEFLPRYLNFVKGLVDSNDLPLNVNREQLQKNKIMKVMGKKLTRKALDMLHKMAEEEEGDDDDSDEEEDEETEKEGEEGDDDDEEVPQKYSEFWTEFGKSIKLGVIEDTKNRKKLMQLLRFQSTRSPDKPISLQSYVDYMPEKQKNIYYISAASMEEAQRSPFLERVKAKGFEVLYFVENLDEYLNIQEFEDYPLQSVTKEGLDLGDGKGLETYMEEKEEDFKPLTDWLKESYGSKVSKVTLSSRLESSPMIIPTGKYGQTANMERITAGQAFGRAGAKATKLVEINFRHPVIKALKDKVAALDEDDEDQNLKDYANMLYDVALVNSGFAINANMIQDFEARMERVVRGGLEVDSGATVEALPEFADDEEEDDEDDEDDDEEEEEEMDLDEEEEEEEEADLDEDEEEESGGHDEL